MKSQLVKKVSLASLSVLLIVIGATKVQSNDPLSISSDYDAEACNAAFPEGQSFFSDLQGIDLSTAQLAQLDVLESSTEEKMAAVLENAQTVVEADASVSVTYDDEAIVLARQTLTAEEKALIEQYDEDYTAQLQDMLTPEQRQQFQQNLSVKDRIDESCGFDSDDPVYGS